MPRVAQVVQRVGLLRPQLERTADQPQSFGKIALQRVDDAEQIERIQLLRLQRQHLSEQRRRLAMPASLMQAHRLGQQLADCLAGLGGRRFVQTPLSCFAVMAPPRRKRQHKGLQQVITAGFSVPLQKKDPASPQGLKLLGLLSPRAGQAAIAARLTRLWLSSAGRYRPGTHRRWHPGTAAAVQTNCRSACRSRCRRPARRSRPDPAARR